MRVITLALIFFVALPSSASAHHVWPPILPNLPTPVIQRAIEQGYVTYAFDQNASTYPGFRNQARQVVDAAYQVIGVPAFEVSSGPDIWLLMPSDSTFINTCGSGAAGCIFYWQDPIMIFFRRALLYNETTGWRTTLAHEGVNGGHAFGLHERYNDQTFTCIPFPNPPTVMSCGSGIWIPTTFDRQWIHHTMLPVPPLAYGLGRNPALYGYWCDTHPAATRVAIMYLDNPGGPIEDDVYYWSGIHAPTSLSGCRGWHLAEVAGRCYFASLENGFNYLRADLRSDVLMGCT